MPIALSPLLSWNEEVQGALDAGRPPHEFRERLMMLYL